MSSRGGGGGKVERVSQGGLAREPVYPMETWVASMQHVACTASIVRRGYHRKSPMYLFGGK